MPSSLRLPSILLACLLAATIRASVNIHEVSDSMTLVTAKGQMDPDGTFTPMSHDEIDAAAAALARNGVTAENRTGLISPVVRRLSGNNWMEIGVAVASALTVEYDGILAASVAPAVFAFKQYQSFSQQREIFTRTMIINVWTAILHNATLADLVSGAMCYNMDWSASDPSLVIAQTTQDLDVVPYSVSYDCFIFAGPNYIATQGDGGWINMATTFNPNKCSYLSDVSDVNCWA